MCREIADLIRERYEEQARDPDEDIIFWGDDDYHDEPVYGFDDEYDPPELDIDIPF